MSHATELRQLTILTKYLPTTKAKNTTFTSLFMNPKCTHPTHTFSFFLQFFFLTLTHQLLNNVITISHHHPATPSHCVVAPPSRCTTATTSLWRCCVVLVLIVATLIDLSCYSLLCHPIATSPLCSSTSSYFFFVPFEIGTPEFSLYPMFYFWLWGVNFSAGRGLVRVSLC